VGGIIYVKRRQRLRLQAKRITIDGPLVQGPAATTGDSEVQEASGTLTPFTLPNLISQLRAPLKKSPPKTSVPPVLNGPGSTQARTARPRDDPEGRNTLVEVVEVMHRLQERVAYLEGRSSGDRVQERRQRRTSAPSQGEDTSRSEDTFDPPPTYKS
jgi:hypothetical protein